MSLMSSVHLDHVRVDYSGIALLVLLLSLVEMTEGVYPVRY